MSEKNMWHRMKSKFSHAGHWQRIEDGLSRGVPDVNYCIRGAEGWIELKQIGDWPKRKTTPVSFRWEKEQRFWARRRGKNGGLVWLLLYVKRTNEWLWFWWEDVAGNEVGRSLKVEEFRELASLITVGIGKDHDSILNLLSRGDYTREKPSVTPRTPAN